MDRGAWWATVHGVAKSDMIVCVHTHIHTDNCVGVNPKQKFILKPQFRGQGKFALHPDNHHPLDPQVPHSWIQPTVDLKYLQKIVQKPQKSET